MTTPKITFLLLLSTCLLVVACGVKGPPLPPLGKQDLAAIPHPSSSPNKGP